MKHALSTQDESSHVQPLLLEKPGFSTICTDVYPRGFAEGTPLYVPILILIICPLFSVRSPLFSRSGMCSSRSCCLGCSRPVRQSRDRQGVLVGPPQEPTFLGAQDQEAQDDAWRMIGRDSGPQSQSTVGNDAGPTMEDCGGPCVIDVEFMLKESPVVSRSLAMNELCTYGRCLQYAHCVREQFL